MESVSFSFSALSFEIIKFQPLIAVLILLGNLHLTSVHKSDEKDGWVYSCVHYNAYLDKSIVIQSSILRVQDGKPSSSSFSSSSCSSAFLFWFSKWHTYSYEMKRSFHCGKCLCWLSLTDVSVDSHIQDNPVYVWRLISYLNTPRGMPSHAIVYIVDYMYLR